MSVVPITTHRLRIRALTEDDLESVFAIYGDEITTAGASWWQPDLASCRQFLARRIANERELGYSAWGVERISKPGLIGVAGYYPHDDEIELGYVIKADYWGHGYGTEAAQAVLAAAPLLARRVYATIRSTNTPSLAVARKIGLVNRGEAVEDERGTKLIFRWP